MKVNEAPEKIYRRLEGKYIKYYDYKPAKISYDEKEPAEYIRTDAFIEKTCSYIRLHSALLDTENNDCMPEWLDKFRNAMKK